MQNFSYQNPTKIIFGKGQINELANEIPAKKRVLIIYGGGSIKKNGVYEQITSALSKHTIFEFSGIEPNPRYQTLMKAVEFIRTNKIDFLLAVGGGSVIDGVKFIAAAVNFKGEPWDILAKQAEVISSLPFGTVLTLPAAGSEMNSGAVITRDADKLVFNSPLVYPKFSILDPTTTYSLPANQTSNGVVDAFIHVVEQYITYPVNAAIQDRFAEGILLTLIEETPKVLANPEDYAARANIMWAATLALNGLIAAGVPEDWATHLIGHELTAKYGLDHGQTLAIVFPSVMHICREAKREKLLQYAKRVWNITGSNDNDCIEQAITKTRNFFESIGIKTHLRDYGIDAACIPIVIEQLKQHGLTALGERKDVTLEIAEQILQNCL